MEKTLIKFRAKLKGDGRSLVWWHKKFASNICKYNYLTKQLSQADAMTEKLYEVIEKYVGD